MSLLKKIFGGNDSKGARGPSCAYERGQWVAVSGCGPLPVREDSSDGSMTVADSDAKDADSFEMDANEVARRVRPLVDEAEAQRIKATLQIPGKPIEEEHEYRRAKAYRKALNSNDLMAMSEAVRAIYARPECGYPEEIHQGELEQCLFRESTIVLGEKPGILKRLARKSAGKMPPPADRSKRWLHTSHFPMSTVLNRWALSRSTPN